MKESLRCVLSHTYRPPQPANEMGDRTRQIACADIILLNKADLAPTDQFIKLETTIRELNPVATIERTTKGAIDLAKILDLRAYSGKPDFSSTAFANESAKHDFVSNKEEGHVHDDHCAHDHKTEITSLLIPLPVLSLAQHEAIDGWIRSLLWETVVPGSLLESKVEILRCKGFWQVKDGRGFVLQGVRSLYETSEVPVEDTEPVAGKIVLIGKGLDKTVHDSLITAIS